MKLLYKLVSAVSVCCLGVLFTGCSSSTSSPAPQSLSQSSKNRLVFNDIELYGEKIPLLQEFQARINTRQYFIDLDRPETNGKLGNGNGIYTFTRDGTPIYNVTMLKPSLILGARMYETMKIYARGSSINPFEALGANDTKVHSVLFFHKSMPKIAHYVFDKDDRGAYKDIRLPHGKFFKEFGIAVLSIHASKIGPLDRPTEVTPHKIEIYALSGDDVYELIEKTLKTREDKEKNEKLIRALALNDHGFYESLYRQKKSLVLPSQSITVLPIDAEPKYAISNYDTIMNSGKYKTMKGSIEKISTATPSKTQTITESSKQETVSTLHKENEKKVETKISTKPTFAPLKDVEKIQLGEDNTSKGAGVAKESQRRNFIDFAESAER